MAAVDALQRLMKVTESRTPFDYCGDTARIEMNYEKENMYAADLVQKYERSLERKAAG